MVKFDELKIRLIRCRALFPDDPVFLDFRVSCFEQVRGAEMNHHYSSQGRRSDQTFERLNSWLKVFTELNWEVRVLTGGKVGYARPNRVGCFANYNINVKNQIGQFLTSQTVPF